MKDRVLDVAEFLSAVERVAGGGTPFDLAAVSTSSEGSATPCSTRTPTRECTVASLIAEGRANRAMARQLHLSARAIERDVQAVFAKLRLPESEDHNRRELAVLAALLGP